MLDGKAQQGSRSPVAADGTLVLHRAAGPAGTVRLENRRPVALEPALAGTATDAAPALLRRLLPVCGWAQGIACARALEAATDAPAGPGTEAARDRLLLAEAAVAGLWRLAVDWPALLGSPADVAGLRAARAALAGLVAALWPQADPLGQTAPAAPAAGAVAAASAALAGLIEAALAGVPAAPAGLAAWAGSAGHPAARLMRRARALVPGPGLMAGDAVPPLAAMAARLAADAGFAAAPDLDGRPGEPGALSALPAAARAACAGLGPLAGRFAAMLLALAEAAARLRAADLPAPDPAAVAIDLGGGWGAGCGQTARGPLVHVLHVAAGRIERFRAVAPTEWLLHPGGALGACLAGLPQGAGEDALRLAVAAFDPCARLVIATDGAGHA